MNTSRITALVGLMLAAGCNSLDVSDLDNPGQDQLETHPTRALVNAAATGMLFGSRVGISAQNGYVMELGIFGRESYNFDPADPRFVTELLTGPLDGGSGAFGGNLFAAPYADIRGGNIILRALTRLPASAMTAEEIDATTGFVQTIQALDFLHVINTRDDFGAPIDVDIDPIAAPAPIATKAQVFTHIANLLDSAQTHLQAGGSAFPFPLSNGFAGFDTPADFLTFNRALRARVAVYTGDFAGALTALQASFLDPAAPLGLGTYFVFSTIAGDRVNTLFDASQDDGSTPRALFAHPSIRTDAQLQVGGAIDQRALDKTAVFSPAKTVSGITTDLKFTIYGSNVAPIPIIRNEELILLRAEANIGLNNLATAVTDLDLIRSTSGNLPAYSGAVTPAALLDELLYNKRYSLLLEGGHRWIDLRRYGMLGTLPKALPNHKIFSRMPFPRNDCLARNPTPATGCAPEAGI
jgi:starch-binding outer membrane protein, SusD/RagB family